MASSPEAQEELVAERKGQNEGEMQGTLNTLYLVRGWSHVVG